MTGLSPPSSLITSTIFSDQLPPNISPEELSMTESSAPADVKGIAVVI